jgi:hypothetical protein
MSLTGPNPPFVLLARAVLLDRCFAFLADRVSAQIVYGWSC